MIKIILLIFLLCISTGYATADKIQVLIVDGPQKHHDYEKTTPVLKQMLERTLRFDVDLSRSSKQSCQDGTYQPDFAAYDVVVINEGFHAPLWPPDTRAAFESFIKNGGGMVSYHAANNAWPEWKEYNRMTGIGGWDGRNEKSGPYLFINDAGEIVRDISAGKGGGHGPRHVYEITVREAEHPIMQGLPATFKHGPDELYHLLRGPAENVTILASAHSAKEYKGTERHEPVLMTITYGKGRIFHTVLGHAVKHIKEGSFVTTFQRGTEWAATGKVTIPVPADFPNQEF